MTPILSTIKSTQTIIRVGSQIWDYIRDDQTAECGLGAPVRIVVEGPGVGAINFTAPDGTGKIISPHINRCEFVFNPFPSAGSWWNGPDVIRNVNQGGRIPGSLVHDFICNFLLSIAAAAGLTKEEVWEWASGILAAVWAHYGHYTPRAKSESWLAYHATRLSRRPYRWLRRNLGFALVILAAITLSGCSGCQAVPDWRVVEADPVIWVEAGVVQTNTPPIRTL